MLIRYASMRRTRCRVHVYYTLPGAPIGACRESGIFIDPAAPIRARNKQCGCQAWLQRHPPPGAQIHSSASAPRHAVGMQSGSRLALSGCWPRSARAAHRCPAPPVLGSTTAVGRAAAGAAAFLIGTIGCGVRHWHDRALPQRWRVCYRERFRVGVAAPLKMQVDLPSPHTARCILICSSWINCSGDSPIA